MGNFHFFNPNALKFQDFPPPSISTSFCSTSKNRNLSKHTRRKTSTAAIEQKIPLSHQECARETAISHHNSRRKQLKRVQNAIKETRT
jgi:hypothetical protein